MRNNPKIRLTRSMVMSVIISRGIYGQGPSEEITFTPAIYKTFHFDSSGIKYICQKRITVRLIPCGFVVLKFKGKAPLYKYFTLEEFCNNFYMVMDEKTGTPYFRFYRK